MNERNRNNLLYAIFGILVLVVSVTGATFAYYTATATYNANTITGNMATITFGVKVDKMTHVDTANNRGLIPMTNAMVQKAVSNASGNGICLDDNSNAACQVYKITINNTGTAGMFLDGYVTLSGGSGTSTDYASATTSMRWAQAFCEETGGSLTSCTTAGRTTTRTSTTSNTTGIDEDWAALGVNTGHAVADIKDAADFNTVTAKGTIQSNPYDIIRINYIRVSKNPDSKYTQAADVSSALVYNQYLAPKDASTTNDTGDSGDTYTDAQVYYIVVWLSETGTDQSIGAAGAHATGANFFSGVVTFMSAQGSEVTGTFADYLAVTPDTKQPAS